MLRHLQIETTNHCNAHCTFCPHDRITEKGFMSDLLYEKILTEAQGLPHLQRVIPMNTGEPFLDKKYVQRLAMIRDMLPKVEIELYTNGSLLTAELVQELKDIPITYHVSVNGLCAETRKKLMGLDDFQQVMEGLKAMEKAGIEYEPTLVFTPDVSNYEARAFYEAGGTVIQYQSWAGTQYHYERTEATSCERAMYEMTVRYNGDVILCCFDALSEVTFGNLNAQTIEEVWQSERCREYQQMHASGRGQELPMCGRCTEGLYTLTG